VRIKVNNLVGESDWTDYVEATTGIEPTRPGIMTFDATTRTTIDLSWTLLEGSDTGGSDDMPLEITYYHLYLDNGLNGTFKLHYSIEGTLSSKLVEYLRPGLTYRFKIQAENSIGLLSSFSTIQKMMAGTLPSAPGVPKLITQSSKQINFTWQEPFDNGGSKIVEYEILITLVSDLSIVSKTIINALVFDFVPAEGMLPGYEY
jgi:hypothetical protein